MEVFNNCSVCFHEYTEEAWVPKVVECGHSFCNKCLTSILQSKKCCPKCRATLSKNIEEYPINFDLLGISKSSKEKGNFLGACTLDMKNELKSEKKILERLLIERESNTCSIESTTASMKKLLRCIKIMCKADEIADVVPDIEVYLEEVNKSLNYRLWETDKDMLRLKDFENSKLFLSKIVHRLQGVNRVFAYTRADLGEWKYGEITFRENRLHIHCLSASGCVPGASLVLLKDVKDCITSRKDMLLFIEVGSQKLDFTLTEFSPFDAFLRCLKFFTGEEEHTIKGLDSEVYKVESENLNNCVIRIPTKTSDRGYEGALYQEKRCEMKKGKVTLHCALNWVCITKWSTDKEVYNLVGKLHENCQIDFDKIELENKVIDCGISLNF